MVSAQKRPEIFRIQPFGQVRRADQIDELDRQEAAFGGLLARAGDPEFARRLVSLALRSASRVVSRQIPHADLTIAPESRLFGLSVVYSSPPPDEIDMLSGVGRGSCRGTDGAARHPAATKGAGRLLPTCARPRQAAVTATSCSRFPAYILAR